MKWKTKKQFLVERLKWKVMITGAKRVENLKTTYRYCIWDIFFPHIGTRAKSQDTTSPLLSKCMSAFVLR